MTTDNILAPVAALTLPDQALLIGGAQRMLSFIDSYAIESNDDFGLAADELKTIKAKQKTLEDQRTRSRGRSTRRPKAVNDLFRGPAELLTRAEGALNKMLTWQRRVEAEAAEARRVAEEAARPARSGRGRGAQAGRGGPGAGGRGSKGAGGRQRAGSGNRRGGGPAGTRRGISRSVGRADGHRGAGDQDRGAEGQGISTSSRLDFEVTSLIELVQHVAKHPELIGLLQVDSVRLRAWRQGVGLACNLPGVHPDGTDHHVGPRGLMGRAMNPSAFLPRSITRLAPTAWTAACTCATTLRPKPCRALLLKVDCQGLRQQRLPTNGPTPCCANANPPSSNNRPRKGSHDESIPALHQEGLRDGLGGVVSYHDFIAQKLSERATDRNPVWLRSRRHSSRISLH